MTSTRTQEPGPDSDRCPAPGTGPHHPAVVGATRVLTGPAGTPPALHLAVSDLPDPGPDRPWQADRQAFGTSWAGPEQARRSAEGEAVERLCNSVPPAPQRIRYATHEELTRRGIPALDPRRLVLYSPRQYARPGFPFRPFLRDSPAHWIEGRFADRDEPVHVPAFLVYTAWRRMPHARPEPLYAFPALGGTAAGPTPGHALRAGLAEVVERDAAAVWWAHARPLPALEPTPYLRGLTGGASREFDIRLMYVENEFGAPVLAAGVRSRAEGWLTYGFAVRPDPVEAAAKALAEAYTLHLTCRTLDNPAATVRTPGRPSPLKPWRADRRYLDSYRGDASDVVEQLCQQQLYLDRRAADRVAPWAWDLPPGRWSDVPRIDAGDAGDTLLDRVRAQGYEVITVDITTPEATAAGMHAARTIVPGTAGAAPAAYPALGAGRLQQAGTRLGWTSSPLPETALNTFPMPHS
ncbi:YcaO-like family protein [Streptomyces bambusae]|uniref:Bacteriocin biosynthesis protein SagD n=1 Tax=Streptomyces bambusae TaxID=1550616 RepID=A0ABS6YXV2_9ACTN|nr:YcaO-like family protein [Streptomyces bambusae]MBW5480325.1 bacteriocin biosynthesis protein SagD [Streptomyces bambusae]